MNGLYPREYCANGLAFYSSAKKPKIVLLHGVGLRLESWLEQIPVLSQKWPLIAFDLPGHGFSEACSVQTLKSVEDYSRIIVDALAKLQIQPYAIIGHSLGALLSLDIISRQLIKAQRTVAISGIFERRQAALKAVQKRADELSMSSQKPDSGPTLRRWFGQTPNGQRARWAQLSDQWLEQCPQSAYAAAYQAFAHSNGPNREFLSQVEQPVMFMTGGDDPNSTAQMSQNMAEVVDKGQCRIIENAKHMLQLTHADEVNQALLEFL